MLPAVPVSLYIVTECVGSVQAAYVFAMKQNRLNELVMNWLGWKPEIK